MGGRGAPFKYQCMTCGGGTQCNEHELRVRTAGCKPFVAPEAAAAAVLHYNGKVKPWALRRDAVLRGGDGKIRYSQCAVVPAGVTTSAVLPARSTSPITPRNFICSQKKKHAWK